MYLREKIQVVDKYFANSDRSGHSHNVWKDLLCGLKRKKAVLN